MKKNTEYVTYQDNHRATVEEGNKNNNHFLISAITKKHTDHPTANPQYTPGTDPVPQFC